MFVAEVELRGKRLGDDVMDTFHWLLGAWLKNGQVIGREHPIVRGKDTLRAIVMVPERSSLAPRWSSKWVLDRRSELAKLGCRIRARVLGREAEGLRACTCRRRHSFVLFTTYIELASPLRCGECFAPVPLYRVPTTGDGEFHDVLCWEADYQACDTLQMHSSTGERFGLRELGALTSSLTRRGRELGDRIRKLTRKPVYYYLHRHCARSSIARENARRCPGCRGEWRLEETWHRLFDFRCVRCLLVSNISFDVR